VRFTTEINDPLLSKTWLTTPIIFQMSWHAYAYSFYVQSAYEYIIMHVFFRGVHGHFHGSLPWWKIEDTVISESAKLVGN